MMKLAKATGLSKAVILAILLVGCALAQETDLDVEDEEATATTTTEAIYYTPIEPIGESYFYEAFNSEDVLGTRWVVSKAKKEGVDEDIAKYDGQWRVEEPQQQPIRGDLGLVLKSAAKHHAIAAKLDRPFTFSQDKPFVLQYEVKFQTPQTCGGAYVKLLSESESGELDLEGFQDKTGYTIMFGPDKCGEDAKLHFIFRHRNPKTGAFEEKHAKKPSGDIKSMFGDKLTHLYTLEVHPDNTFRVMVDQKLVNSGSLLEDFTPAVNPAEEIDDPEDKKPSDWDDRKKIADPEAVKPADWDETAPRMVADPEAVKPADWLEEEALYVADPEAEQPEDWDEEMDGEWEPPQLENPACQAASGCGPWTPPDIPNPAYKGPWSPPMVDNPAYQGVWAPRRIPNPDYFQDLHPFKMTPVSALGLELWSMTDDILFDNFLVTSDPEVARQWAAESYEVKRAAAAVESGRGGSGESVVGGLLGAAEEQPWLWAVYGLVVLIPLFLCAKFCFGTSKQGGAADPKKTDAPTADDPAPQEGEEAEGDEGDDEGEDEGEASGKMSKADLEETVDQQSKEGEEEEEEEEEGGSGDAGATRRTSPRKRRARKE